VLTDAQAKRIVAVLAIERDANDDGFYKHAKGLIGACTSLELHLIASEWNWDAGWGALQAIVEHPKCDAATASLIFWRGSPGTYLDDWMLAADSEEMDVEHRDMLVEIQKRAAKQCFARSGISFNPGPLIEPSKLQNILPCMYERFEGLDLTADTSRIRKDLHRTGKGA
jgi:hypothetical protein